MRLLAGGTVRTFMAAPKASMLIESMRDIGYSLETALADVIDNSITAKASTIRILAESEGDDFRIGIMDDGCGMSESELRDAMRPGSRSPLEGRGLADLGRFGLGLKTASFSQCRRLTVVTRKDGRTSAAIWDLDLVAEKDDWIVQVPDDPGLIPWAEQVGSSGTLVLWENLDRVVDQDGPDKRMGQFVRRLDEARAHLELVFHRFLSGEPGLKKIRILLNERPLEPFDPFNSRHPATIVQPASPEVIRVGDHEVSIQTFTLPHHKMVTAAEWERYAGRGGYLRSQGFYVYREKRLIIHGTWFGLARQTELTKLARVRIDTPNGLDAEWKVDVKKSSAQPPHQVRDRLRNIIETIGATSKRVYTRRGQTLVSNARLPSVWDRQQNKGEISYRVNPDHPVLKEFFDRLSDELKDDFCRVVQLVGSALPMDALFADLAGQPENVRGDTLTDEALSMYLAKTVKLLREGDLSPDDIRDVLRKTEPFRSNWQRTQEMLNRGFQECLV